MSEVGREAAIAAGVAKVVFEGDTVTNAANLLDIPRTTLRDAITRYTADPAALNELGRQGSTLHLAVMAKAGELVFDGLEAAPYAEQLRAYGIASDKAALYLGIGKDGNASGGDGQSQARSLALLVDALSGREVTVSVRDLAQDDASGHDKAK